jgi:hypothetical protein
MAMPALIVAGLFLLVGLRRGRSGPGAARRLVEG